MMNRRAKYIIIFLIFIIIYLIILQQNKNNQKYNLLNSNLFQQFPALLQQLEQQPDEEYDADANKNDPKIFCFILTKFSDLEKKTRVVYNTWAHKCDNYKFIAEITEEYRLQNNISNSTFNQSLEISYNNTFTILQPAGLIRDEYNKLTEKVLLTLRDAYNRYNGYDWYLKCDDDTFVFVDNMKKFLRDKNASQPVTYGYDFKVIVDRGYHSGGGGYLLSREALNRIGPKINESIQFCESTGTEDVDIARCLRRLDVYLNKSIDEEGRERFHCLSLNDFYNGVWYDWLVQYAANPLRKGVNCCSDTSITFHYMYPEEMIKLATILKEQQLEKTDMSFKYILKKFYNVNDSQLIQEKRRRR